MELTYATIAEINTYAAANGEQDWSGLSESALTGLVNNAAGYLEGARTIVVDNIDDGNYPVSAGDKFMIDSDSTLTVYTVSSTAFTTVTVAISFYPALSEDIDDDDLITFTMLQPTQKQIRCLVNAAKDIIRYHKIQWPDGSLWLSGNTDLNKANILQAIYLSRVIEARDSAAQMSEISGGSLSDGVVSTTPAISGTLCDDAKFLVDKVKHEYYAEIEAFDDYISEGRKGFGR